MGSPPIVPRLARRSRKRSSRIERLLDRCLGTGLLLTVGVLRRRRPRPERIGSIGILQTVAIGDAVLTTALLGALRVRYPEARLVLFLGPTNAGLAPLLADVDEIVTIPVKRPLRAVEMLRRHRVDVLIDCGPSWPRLNALLAAFAGARYTVGFKSRRQYRHYAYDCVVEHSAAVHEVENYRRLGRAIDATTHVAPHLTIPRPAAVDLSARPFIVFHPWPGGMLAALREWDPGRWVALGQHVTELGYQVVVTGSPADAPRSADLTRRLESASVTAKSVAGTLDLLAFAQLLSEAAAVVSVDTGALHIAAAVGAPVVSLHGPSTSRRWGPVGAHGFPVDAPGEGCGFQHFGFERRGRDEECMSRITIDAVRDRLAEALAFRTRNRERPPASTFV
jgi:heptosyltransferase-3